MSARNAARILIVDDDPGILRILRGYLEQAGLEVREARDGDAAMHALRRERPDLLVLDLMLPGSDGWEITRRVRADPGLRSLPILMLTARVDDADKIVGLELGADDYVTKPFNPREVLARVRALLRRSRRDDDMPDAGRLRCGGLRLDLGARRLHVDGRPVRLTPSEFEILRALMARPGYVVPRELLIERALGPDYEGLDRSLDSHIRNLRAKIEPRPGGPPTYLRTEYGIGYRLVDPDAEPEGP